MDTLLSQMISLRRTLHQNPELSGREHQTADTIVAHLRAVGLPAQRFAETGVVCDLPGQQPGARIALRADTDALPITERTGLPFASRHPGRMHACGHDGHSSILLGAAMQLAAAPPPAPIRCIWQPAEEAATGAQSMVNAGVLDGVDMIFGGHIDPRFPSGQLIVTDGAVNASTDHLCVTVTGQQAHGARPHESRDAVLAAAQLIVALQSIVSRELPPDEAAVVSIGRMEAGCSHNIIAGSARLEGTIRSQNPAVRAQLAASIRRIAAGIGAAHRAEIAVAISPGAPALINEPVPTRLARHAAEAVVGAAQVSVLPERNMGGEDFAVYLQHVPGCYVRFGAACPERPFAPAHSSRFDFHEAAMLPASRWMAAVARAAGGHRRSGTL